jgi:hypothetical protein
VQFVWGEMNTPSLDRKLRYPLLFYLQLCEIFTFLDDIHTVSYHKKYEKKFGLTLVATDPEKGAEDTLLL